MSKTDGWSDEVSDFKKPRQKITSFLENEVQKERERLSTIIVAAKRRAYDRRCENKSTSSLKFEIFGTQEAQLQLSKELANKFSKFRYYWFESIIFCGWKPVPLDGACGNKYQINFGHEK